MKDSHFVGRVQEISKLKKLLLESDDEPAKLRIQSIEGPGGVGKSTVFNTVLQEIDLDSHGYLTLRVDGADGHATTLTQLLKRLVDSAAHRSIAKKPCGYYFPATKDAILAAEEIRAEAIGELKKRGINDADIEAFSRCYDHIMSLGQSFTESFPKAQKLVDFDKLSENGKLAVKNINALKEESVYFFERLGIFNGSALRNSLKQNAAQALSHSLIMDLKDLILGDHENPLFRPANSKNKNLTKLLIVIDDYEALQPVIQTFLIPNLLKRLKSEGFSSTAVILGRDRLAMTDPSWDQHFSGNMSRRIDVKKFDRPEMDQLLSALGVNDLPEQDRAWRDTEGYPYLVRLWMDEFESGGRSAIVLRQFHMRITRWMTERQRNWLDPILFLNEVNPSTLKVMLDDPTDADEAYAWFEGEASIRDTKAKKFVAAEYVRTRLLDYLQIRSPTRHKELLRRSREFEIVNGEPVSARSDSA